MNLSELQAFLEESSWDDDPLPAHPSDAKTEGGRAAEEMHKVAPISPEFADPFDDNIPTLTPSPQLNPVSRTNPVKLVPRVKEELPHQEIEQKGSASIKDRLMEVEMAQKMGYLLCKCTWPPQIMVLTGTDHVYRCRRCSRVREM